MLNRPRKRRRESPATVNEDSPAFPVILTPGVVASEDQSGEIGRLKRELLERDRKILRLEAEGMEKSAKLKSQDAELKLLRGLLMEQWREDRGLC